MTAEYFLLTFTLPAELCSLAWHHQRLHYSIMIQAAWKTVRTFAKMASNFRAVPGRLRYCILIRRLDFHRHVYLVMPTEVIDAKQCLWRTKSKNNRHCLFNHNALTSVFRAKLLSFIADEGLILLAKYLKSRVVDCKLAQLGRKALIYFGRYLYWDVIQEKNIIGCKGAKVQRCKDHLSFPKQQNKKVKISYRTRRAVFMVDFATCAAEGIPTRLKFWFFASQE